MTLAELSCAVQYNIPVKVIVLNNEEQGMVTQWQSLSMMTDIPTPTKRTLIS